MKPQPPVPSSSPAIPPATPAASPAPSEAVAPDAADRSRTHISRQHETGPAPRLPHERDESADSQAGNEQVQEHGRRAFDDLQQGRVDTDRGPVMDSLYHRSLRTRKPASGPKAAKRRGGTR